MNGFPWDQTVVGWVHITSAAAVAGFLFVWLLALLPAGGDAARAVVSRYRPIFWTAALLLPLTGAYTWYVRTGQNYPDFYFHVIYTKILLYVVLFGIAGALTKPRAAGDRPGSGKTLLGVCVLVTLLILFLSAFMRRVKPQAVETASARQVTLLAAETAALSRPGTANMLIVVEKKGVAPGWQS